jgi:hypothetical protein
MHVRCLKALDGYADTAWWVRVLPTCAEDAVITETSTLSRFLLLGHKARGLDYRIFALLLGTGMSAKLE